MLILITGGNGMLGHHVKKVFKGHELIVTDIFDMDVRSYDNVMSYVNKLPGIPDYIWHMAAETDLEMCQIKPEYAYHTNTIGTINVMKLAQLFDVPMIYMSTAGVFRGDKGNPYVETDMPQPVNHYGRSKYYGELALNSYDKCYIFRMSWAMGGGPKLDKKFVNKICSQIRRGTKEIRAISSIIGSPTYFKDVAMTIYNCLMKELPFGIYHISGASYASRFGVAEEIVQILKVKVKVIPVLSNYFNPAYPCPRAKNEGLASQKDFKGADAMRHWHIALKDYLKEYYADLFAN